MVDPHVAIAPRDDVVFKGMTRPLDADSDFPFVSYVPFVSILFSPLLPNPDKVVRIVAALASYGKDMLYGGLWEAWCAREYP